MIIRMEEEYLGQVLRIEQNSFSIPWTEEMFLLELEAPYSHSWIWLQDETVLGYVVGWLEFETFHIANLAVAPEVRGRGVGRQLMEYALDWALWHDVERSLLEVRASNHPARILYASLGYEPIAVRKGYYEAPCEDALILEKRL